MKSKFLTCLVALTMGVGMGMNALAVEKTVLPTLNMQQNGLVEDANEQFIGGDTESHGEEDEIDEGINLQDARGNTALHMEVFRGGVESVLSLLSRGANPNIRNSSGKNPLHIAVERFTAHVRAGLGDADEFMNIIDALLQEGADPLAMDMRGRDSLDLLNVGEPLNQDVRVIHVRGALFSAMEDREPVLF